MREECSQGTYGLVIESGRQDSKRRCAMLREYKYLQVLRAEICNLVFEKSGKAS